MPRITTELRALLATAFEAGRFYERQSTVALVRRARCGDVRCPSLARSPSRALVVTTSSKPCAPRTGSI